MPNHSSHPAAAPSAFADITPVLDHLPPAPPVLSSDDVNAKLNRYSVKAGPLLPLLTHLKRWQKNQTTLSHPRVCAFASHYAVPADAATRTLQTIAALQADQHPLKLVTAALNADLRVYELDMAQTQRTPQQAAQAMTYGMLSIADKGDVIVLTALSEGAERAAAELTLVPGRNADALLHALVPVMGLDFFAALGAALAARLAQQPVLVCGAFGAALLRVLDHLSPQAADHCVPATTDDVTHDMLPVFAAIQNLQQIQFLVSFLPAQHVRIV